MISKNPKKTFPPQKQDGDAEQPMRLATVREACQYGHFSHTKCYDYINDGRIDAYKRDSRTMIDLNSIDKMNAAMPKIAPKPPKPKVKQFINASAS